MKKIVLPVLLSLLLVFSLGSSAFASESLEKWEEKNNLPISRGYPHVAIANQTIYLIGGTSSGYTQVKNVYEYNQNDDSWTEKAPMPTARFGAATAVVDDVIYVIGGKSGSSYLNIVEAYNSKTNTWTSKAKLPETRSYTSGISINNKIYVIGGYNSSGSNTKTVYEYDPATDKWSTKSNMPTARSGVGLAVLNGKIYAVGGENGGTTVEIYDPVTDTWETGVPYPEAAIFIGVTELNGNLYGVGGGKPDGSTKINSVYEFNPLKNEWTKKLDMPTKRRPGVVSFNNAIYAIAGEATTSTNKVQVYYPGINEEPTDPTDPTTPVEPSPDPEPSGDRAILVVTMTTGLEKEYDLPMSDINAFLNWYDARDIGIGPAKFAINKYSNNKGPFNIRTDYVIFDKILTFEVSEYTTN
ncbi:kelch repeat-containing protein [Paenibacillus sp. FSL R5-0517]|uniref:Kelch repeat-containing protein n=1 Tax=Paenibacillus sp. FSL R5-0517 TaxID=2921647 RepID=UPI0030D82E3A